MSKHLYIVEIPQSTPQKMCDYLANWLHRKEDKCSDLWRAFGQRVWEDTDNQRILRIFMSLLEFGHIVVGDSVLECPSLFPCGSTVATCSFTLSSDLESQSHNGRNGQAIVLKRSITPWPRYLAMSETAAQFCYLQRLRRCRSSGP